jgi:osmotically inducible protein OsmC
MQVLFNDGERSMTTRTSTAEWTGTLKEGRGRMRVGNGAYEGAYTFASRFEEGDGTNPEELIAAAHAGCFSMFLSALLTKAGYAPTSVKTSATVHLGEGPTITLIELDSTAKVPGIDAAAFQQQAEAAKRDCPVSKALAGPQIRLKATLAS